LKDAARFYSQYEGEYEIYGAFFVVYGEYDKKAFKLLLSRSDVRDIVRIKTFARSKPKTMGSASLKEKDKQKKKAFIVHGRDKTPALELARLIERRFPIETIFLEEKPHRGRTLIEKLEDYSNVDFAFITLTPDDIGALKGERPKERGRQNVIFELGQFIGKIGRKNVCLLIKGDIEIPSDLQGIGYHRFYKKIKECFIDVENELRDANLI
jgi:predicted nucleotide-binding protein